MALIKIKKIFGLTSDAKTTKTNKKKKRALKRIKTFVQDSMDVSLTSQRKYNGDPHMCFKKKKKYSRLFFSFFFFHHRPFLDPVGAQIMWKKVILQARIWI